jgi:hypothetical protein
MSYCRWSSMDFQCDVYCYEHYGNYIVVHVAARRHDLSTNPDGGELPEPVSIREDGAKAWLARYEIARDFLEKCELKPIGLKHDGEGFTFGDLDKAADFLEELKEIGYNVPDNAIKQLREVAKEDDEE